MKKYFSYLRRHLLEFVVFLMIFYWVGFFAVEFLYGPYHTSDFSFETTIETSMEASELDKAFFLEAIDGQPSPKTNKKIVDTLFNDRNFKITKEGDIITIFIPFVDVKTDSDTLVYQTINRHNKFISYVADKIGGPYQTHCNNPNGFLWGLLTLEIGLVGLAVLYVFLSKKEHEVPDETFDHLFSKNYWMHATEKFRNFKIKDMTTLAIFLALVVAVKLLSNYIPSGFGDLKIGFAYLILALICMIYGPIWALFVGAFSDIVGFFLTSSSSTFMPGYTLQAMLSCLTYALFLYRRKFSFASCLLSRIVVNLILNALYGSFLYSVLYGLDGKATLDYMMLIELPKNIVYLVPQAVLLYVFLSAIMPVLKSRNLVPENV